MDHWKNCITPEETSGLMGGLLHSFDIGQTSTSRKLFTHKGYADGLEAPRNSLELPMDRSQYLHDIHENTPFSFQLKQHASKRNFYPCGTAMKKLIDEEVPNRTNTRRNSPSLVARLMGMDTLPSDVKPAIHLKESQNENSINSKAKKEHIESTLTHYKPLGVMAFKQRKQNLFSYGVDGDYCESPRPTKPLPREHPQEDLLQKFKKDFEAWQSAKVWERSRAVGLDHSLQQANDSQILARGNLNREKMVLYEEAERISSQQRTAELVESSLEVRQGSGSYHGGYMRKESQSSSLEARNSKNRTSSAFEQFPVVKFNEKNLKSTSPTRIVILKPSIGKCDEMEESCPGSPQMVESEGNMEDFLEEVRKRLGFEIQKKAATDTRTTGSMNEIHFSGRQTEPIQIARHIAKQIRENVTRDFRTMLIRSESTRSYRSEVQLNGPNSPEFIQRDTREFLSDRLRNVLENTTYVKSRGSRPSELVEERVKLTPTTDFTKLKKKMSYWEDGKGMTREKTGPFRKEQENKAEFRAADMSPRNLVRSFSAPVSGTAFGKLLLEDQHILTAAHIQRKHESIEKTSADVRKNRKDGFNFRGTVSNLRHNLTFRGKLFGKKTRSMAEYGEKESDSLNSIVTAPSVILTFGIAQENFTEVPPSPASVCSSSHDELFKLSHLSPNSPLEAAFVEDHPSLLASGEISTNLPELQNLSDLFDIARSEEISTAERPHVSERAEMEGREEVYLREILVTAGLYEGESLDETLRRWEAPKGQIPEWVFEEVEEAYSTSRFEKMGGEESFLDSGKTAISHKMLFDLLNEALPSILRQHPLPALKRSLRLTAPPHGKKLLDDLWHQIETYLMFSSPGESPSLDCLVEHDLQTTTTLWSGMQHEEDNDLVSGDIEWIIVGQLIDEFVLDMATYF